MLTVLQLLKPLWKITVHSYILNIPTWGWRWWRRAERRRWWAWRWRGRWGRGWACCRCGRTSLTRRIRSRSGRSWRWRAAAGCCPDRWTTAWWPAGSGRRRSRSSFGSGGKSATYEEFFMASWLQNHHKEDSLTGCTLNLNTWTSSGLEIRIFHQLISSTLLKEGKWIWREMSLFHRSSNNNILGHFCAEHRSKASVFDVLRLNNQHLLLPASSSLRLQSYRTLLRFMCLKSWL